MKFQAAQHDLARPGPSEVRSVTADGPPATHDSMRAVVVLLSAADPLYSPLYSLWAIHVAISLSELIKALRRRMRGAVTARGASGELDGRLGLRDPPTPVLCHQHDTLRPTGKNQVRLVKIDRISAPIVRPHALGACIAKSIAS
ncbi:hypothetical protein AAFG13_35050 [Bradyrhizobium sp. B124]|uniref:hypothetical protein n=1 Tax=Bradyrhizobium sp. B124 TaxID=3140245 RepID=UPI00318336C0